MKDMTVMEFVNVVDILLGVNSEEVICRKVLHS
jgi:hypothetical protein